MTPPEPSSIPPTVHPETTPPETDPPGSTRPSGLLYGLNDRPDLPETLWAAMQHVLAAFVGTIAPPLLICRAIGLDAELTRYTLSMALLVSGIATIIQAKRLGPIGSGLLSIQGTSFSFVAPLSVAGLASLEAGRTPEDTLAMIFGTCFLGAFVEIGLSQVLHLVPRIATPLVTGIVVLLIGVTLLQVGAVAMGGGFGQLGTENFADGSTLGLAVLVLATIAALSLSRNLVLRTGSVAIGLGLGYAIAAATGQIDWSRLAGLPIIQLPIPFRYGLAIDLQLLVPVMLIYLVTTLESIGDITATSAISGEPIRGRLYRQRLRGGILGDGVNSLLASMLNTFPNTTFSENNGILELTGIASRYIGYFVGLGLAILGVFPVFGGAIELIPDAVLGGATLLMFGTVAAIGIRILGREPLGHREITIMALSLGAGLGVAFVPDLLASLPEWARSIFGSGISAGGTVAIVLNLILPLDSDSHQA